MGPGGRSRLEETVCPTRQLEDAPEIDLALDWFLWSVEMNPFTGRPQSIREWPRRGGFLRQPAKLVAIAQFLMAEMAYLRPEPAAGRK